MPHSGIHWWMDTNWKPASPVSKLPNSQIVSAPVITAVPRPTRRTRSGRRCGVIATATAPNTGSSTIAVRMGNWVASIRRTRG